MVTLKQTRSSHVCKLFGGFAEINCSEITLYALCELSHRMLFKSKNINTKTLAQKNTQSMT
ncbi:MAG: hypothetical protein V7K21_28225, partial [Nostoc sp.]|uniref:hypothetical protein n=1 Tax=Nostoc sp. TaxID=1180 RepID=UPI002FFB7866